MTTAEKFAKRILLCVLCLLVAFAMLSCNKSNQDAFEQLESLLADDGDAVKGYIIVLPAEASSELAVRAEVLAQSINNKTGISCECYYDNQAIVNQDATVYILLGDTSFIENAKIQSLNRDDYVYSVNGRYVTMGGKSSNATMAAIEYFEQNVLPFCENADITSHEADFEYKHTYELQSLQLCDFDFKNFKIICTSPRAAADSKHALKLRELIADKCGAYPDICFETKSTDGVRELVVSLNQAEGGSASISFDGEDVVLGASDAYGISVLAQRLYSLMLSNIDGNKSVVNIENKLSVSYNSPNITFSTLVTNFDDEIRDTNLFKTFSQMVLSQNTDIIFFDSIDAVIWNECEINFNNYEIKTHNTDDSTVSVLACKKSTLAVENLTVETAEGCVFFELDIKRISSGESESLCVALETDSSKRTANLQSFKQRLDKSMAAMFVCADSGALNAADGNIFEHHNALLSAGQKIRRIAVLSSSSNTMLSLEDIAEETQSARLNFTLGKNACEEFLSH